MVWGGVAYGRRTPLHVIHGNMNALKYRDEILAPLVVPFAHQHNSATGQRKAACGKSVFKFSADKQRKCSSMDSVFTRP